MPTIDVTAGGAGIGQALSGSRLHDYTRLDVLEGL